MAKKKKQKQNSIPVRTVAGFRLCVWCKGGLDESGHPITSPWKLVYAPYWLDGYEKKAAAPGWNNTQILAYVIDGKVDYDSSDEAYQMLSTISDDKRDIDVASFTNPTSTAPCI